MVTVVDLVECLAEGWKGIYYMYVYCLPTIMVLPLIHENMPVFIHYFAAE